ncbi:hypothetical protein [uncultured Oscillibacter sp.]|jgi:hypothetical protein|uniref:hypothetical protein n=1 Tax=uncultured Oscillibacter sp. TaxID=876091 RepID=UPI002670B249|nr:hypothetical protein [uncultured Oscillibacter sp.]
MNDYRITYTTEAGDSFDSIITERTEAAARKFFTSMNKGLGFTVASIELHRENTCATKQQERDALAAIRRMVEELGPQSYLATAFEGVFEDAESNIENDFGDSMKTRWLHADAQLNAAKGTIEELEAHKRSMQETIDRLQRERGEAEARQVTDTDIVHLIRLAEKDLAEAEQRRDEAAQDIVTYADDPACEEFRQAVATHRNATSSVEAKKERLGRLNSIRNAG